MVKIADRYFKTDPWNIIEEGFNPQYGRVAESVFSLGNEYMGVRGFFEEDYSGDTLLGSYFNGIYERRKLPRSAYKGITDSIEFMVNSVNWLYTRIIADDEILDLNVCDFSKFIRKLNLKNGVLTRSFIWHTKNGKKLKLTFERFLAMKNVHIGAQKISVKPLNFSGSIKVILGLDFSIKHYAYDDNFWECQNKIFEDSYLSITGTVKGTKQQVFSSCYITGDFSGQKDLTEKEKIVAKEFVLQLSKGNEATLTRLVINHVCSNPDDKNAQELFKALCNSSKTELMNLNYSDLKLENFLWWDKVWESSDIVIKGDELNQQGIRYCIFQMFQTYHGARKGTNIGAKGLTGEAYNGNAFWDTEVYCLPFFIFNDIEAAKNLLLFRYYTLPEAKKRAESLDCKGAFYPIATISGRECCDLWQHASLQLQASTGVAYGIWFYEKMSNDKAFLFDYGLEMLAEICRMLATRGAWTENRTKYGYYCVMGPDEFQMMVNHNFYTNYMARFTFNYTLDVLDMLKKNDEKQYTEFIAKMNLSEEELNEWKEMADKMYIPYDEETGLYEQHDGYFKLPHVDIHSIPVEDFPLYHNWSYDRIYRNDMIKQPDVLMLMLMFNNCFSEKEIKTNYEYYEPRCIHESSLSPSVHSILASQLKKHDEAYEFFKFATRMDLDNYNRNTNEGLHTTSIAAAWMNIVYGFGGMRSDGDILSFAPSIPEKWSGYSFRVTYFDTVIHVEVEKNTVSFRAINGKPVKIKVYDEIVEVSKDPETFDIPQQWRG